MIAGVIGSYKFSFDVWGDTVNIAARCEQNSKPHQINISETFQNTIQNFFNFTHRGDIEVKKSWENKYVFLNSIVNNYSQYNKGYKANSELRQLAGLTSADFIGLRNFIISKLKSELSNDLSYHSIEHTLNVELAVQKYAKLEGLDKVTIFRLRTAALFHDSGFLIKMTTMKKLVLKF